MCPWLYEQAREKILSSVSRLLKGAFTAGCLDFGLAGRANSGGSGEVLQMYRLARVIAGRIVKRFKI